MSDYTLMQSTADKFSLNFGKLPISSNITDNKKLILHLHETVLPGVNFGLQENDWLAYKEKTIIENMTFEDLTCSFTVDENYENWKLLFRWLSSINNNKDVAAKNKSEYATDANLILYDNFNEPIMTIGFVDIFPYSMDSLPLSYRDNEEYLNCSCTFAYDYFEIK